jgi:GTP-binding protein HflX
MINKMDAIYDEFAVARMKSLYSPIVETSVKTNEGMEALLKQVGDTIHELCPTTRYCIPESRYDLIAHIRRTGQVETIEYTDHGIEVGARIQKRFQGPLENFKLDAEEEEEETPEE